MARYLLHKWLGGPKDWSRWVRKISPPPGFLSRTVQSVASCYTDRAIPAHSGTRRIFFNVCYKIWQYSRRNFEARFASAKKTFLRLLTVPYRRRKALAGHVDNGGKKKLMQTLVVKVLGRGYLANREGARRIMGCRKIGGFNRFKITLNEPLESSC